MAAGEEFGFSLDEIRLVTTGAKEIDLEAGYDAGVGADVGAEDDIRAVG